MINLPVYFYSCEFCDDLGPPQYTNDPAPAPYNVPPPPPPPPSGPYNAPPAPGPVPYNPAPAPAPYNPGPGPAPPAPYNPGPAPAGPYNPPAPYYDPPAPAGTGPYNPPPPPSGPAVGPYNVPPPPGTAPYNPPPSGPAYGESFNKPQGNPFQIGEIVSPDSFNEQLGNSFLPLGFHNTIQRDPNNPFLSSPFPNGPSLSIPTNEEMLKVLNEINGNPFVIRCFKPEGVPEVVQESIPPQPTMYFMDQQAFEQAPEPVPPTGIPMAQPAFEQVHEPILPTGIPMVQPAF